MRRALVITLALACLFALDVTLAAAAGVPEIDRANATFNLDPVDPFTHVTCAGEDGPIPYRTFTGGSWKGAENETTPGFTDYVLTNSILVNNPLWTVNLSTKRGVLTAHIRLSDPNGAPVYSGRLTLITQGLPMSATVRGRGWIDAPTFTSGTPDGGTLLANVEISFDPALVGSGTFGDAAPPLGFGNFSVTTVNQTC